MVVLVFVYSVIFHSFLSSAICINFHTVFE